MYMIRAQSNSGYREIFGEKNDHIRLLNFGLLRLDPGQEYTTQTGHIEVVMVLLQGDADVEVGEKTFSGLHRDGIFQQKATAVYAPIESTIKVVNKGDEVLEFALCGTPAETRYPPFLVTPEEVEEREVGRDNWRRTVNDIVVKNADGRVHRIIVGETYNQPGNWSSYPPHKHDDYQPGVEACMEEVYYYRTNPSEGFGVQMIYTSDHAIDEAHTVRDGDTFLIPRGYHPVCAAGGYELYYLWMMAGETDRVMIPNDDPVHTWLKNLD